MSPCLENDILIIRLIDAIPRLYKGSMIHAASVETLINGLKPSISLSRGGAGAETLCLKRLRSVVDVVLLLLLLFAYSPQNSNRLFLTADRFYKCFNLSVQFANNKSSEVVDNLLPVTF